MIEFIEVWANTGWTFGKIMLVVYAAALFVLMLLAWIFGEGG